MSYTIKPWQDLPSYIIFICPFEPFDKGRHIYTFRNVCLEDTSLELRDGATKIFLSSVGTADDVAPDVKRFLEYVNGILSNDAFVQEIDQEIKRVKKLEEERVRYMTYAMKMHWHLRCGLLLKYISASLSKSASYFVVHWGLHLTSMANFN